MLIAGEIVNDKPGKGAFYATGLGDILTRRGIRQLVFARVTTEVCVQTTMREANDRGYEGLLATESYFPAFHEAAIAMITAQGGIVGWAAPTAAILEALHGSRGQGFRRISAARLARDAASAVPPRGRDLPAVAKPCRKRPRHGPLALCASVPRHRQSGTGDSRAVKATSAGAMARALWCSTRRAARTGFGQRTAVPS
ncbi:cysteine hydrolase family protein [Phaeovulum sp. W22_SRMD_FR3]|uniref:cysteine hydrolase family protein n=1 Tax=Phaeovulum sp. W22_SRMD_FR3 TaxID=3240274 RepID=UPI003F99DC50